MREDFRSDVQPLSPHGPPDDQRQAFWFPQGVLYSHTRWPLGLHLDGITEVVIDYDYPLGRSRNLLECTSLYRSAKEFAFWSRESGWTALNEKMSHKQAVQRLFHILSALSLAEIYNLSEVKPEHLKKILKDAIGGVDKLLRASERIDALLTEYHRKDEFPRHWLLPTGGLDRVAIIKNLNLPDFTEFRPAVSRVFNSHCQRLSLPFAYEGKTEHRAIGLAQYSAYERTCDALYAMRHYMDSHTLVFDPVVSKQRGEVKRKTLAGKKTPIAPPRLVFHLLAKSARLILEEGPTSLDTYRELQGRAPSTRRALRTVGRLHRQILDLLTACLVVLAALLARRPLEVRLLRVGCLFQDASGNWWIKVLIAKGGRRYMWMPAPETVVRAVQFLEALHKPTAEFGNSTLFSYYDVKAQVVKRVDPADRINLFAKRMETPLFKSAKGEMKVWHWQARQCRRFAAYLYFWKYEASIEAVATLLSESDIATARIYTANDPKSAALWAEEEWAYVEFVVAKIVNGERTHGGMGAVVIGKIAAKVAEVFRRRVRVVTPDMVIAGVVEVQRRRGVRVTPNWWGVCMCPTRALGAEKANCRKKSETGRSGVGADLTKAAPEVCGAGCPWCVSTEGTRDETYRFMSELEIPPNDLLEGSVVEDLWKERVANFRAFVPLLEPRADQGI